MSDQEILHDYLKDIKGESDPLVDMAALFIKNLPFLSEKVVEGTVWYSIWARKDKLSENEFAREVVELAKRMLKNEGPNLPTLTDKYTSLKETRSLELTSSEAPTNPAGKGIINV